MSLKQIGHSDLTPEVKVVFADTALVTVKIIKVRRSFCRNTRLPWAHVGLEKGSVIPWSRRCRAGNEYTHTLLKSVQSIDLEIMVYNQLMKSLACFSG